MLLLINTLIKIKILTIITILVKNHNFGKIFLTKMDNRTPVVKTKRMIDNVAGICY